MKNFVFGIENYCKVTFIGDKNNEKKNKWFVNKTVMLKNGFDFYESISYGNELYDINGENNYFEVEYYDGKKYFENLDFNLSFLYCRELESYFMPVDYLVKMEKKFLFIIDTGNYKTISKINLSDKILNLLLKDECKIVFHTSYEPFDPHSHEFMPQINYLANKYKLTQDNFKIITGNLIIQNNEEYPCEFIPYPYFLENPWFIKKDKKKCEVFNYGFDYRRRINNMDEGNRFILLNKNIKKFYKKFLCYNRRPRPHRKFLFYKIYNNSFVYENSFLSLNNEFPVVDSLYFQDFQITDVDEINKINNFFSNNRISWTFDEADLNNNQASNFEEWYHKNTFVSLVSETSEVKDVVFISEKTFKPIFACQPFIMCGNPHTLEILKSLGFKTFDKWWDESYDSEEIFEKRVEKIIKILEEICNKSDNELCVMLNEMEDILIHNYEVFINVRDSYFKEAFSSINFKTNNINKRLI